MKKQIRNIFIVAIFTVGSGWLGIWVNHITGNTEPLMQSLGALIWLISPAIAGFLLRAFGADGWKDAGFGLNLSSSWKWYLAAILVYPLCALISFGLALAFNAISIEGFISQGFSAYASSVGIMILGSLMKNIFEEFAWRGYLTPRLDAAKIHPILNHLIVGILWWSWHLPYYYYFLDKAVLQSFLTVSLPVFLLIALLVLFPTAILFGELRLISQSIWPVFLLHNIINGLSMPLLMNGFIKLGGITGIILTPSNDGILTSILLGALGFGIYRYRIYRKPSSPLKHP